MSLRNTLREIHQMMAPDTYAIEALHATIVERDNEILLLKKERKELHDDLTRYVNLNAHGSGELVQDAITSLFHTFERHKMREVMEAVKP